MTEYKIEKPKLDKRSYEFLTLDNGMDVLLIYDKDTDMSAASVSVRVGYNNDPIEYQGLAHFLEHMLFMGTKKYPDENLYHKTIIETGGFANAHTMANNTTYYFQTINEHFHKCLDLFAEFFIEPLFKKDSIDREINAVHSEFNKNITHEQVRSSSIIKTYITNNHPYYNFGIGNKSTLDKPDIRKVLLEFYDKYYSANQMKLVILANKKMKDHIIKIFSKVKNKNVKHETINFLPFTVNDNNKLCYKLIKIVPVKEYHSLELAWQIPKQNKEYKPLNYLAHLLGHEGEGGIYNFLRKNDLCISLMSAIFDGDESFHLFGISIYLTDHGFKHVPGIIDCIFKYIKMMHKMNRVDDIYNELITADKIAFNYSTVGDKINYVSSLSMNMLDYEYTKIISGGYLLNKYTDEVKEEILNCLKYITKKDSIIVISSNTYENIAIKQEKYYGAKYIDYDNPNTYGKEFSNKKFDYNPKLPEKNIFEPSEKLLHMIKPSGLKISKNPLEIILTGFSNSEIWYKYDNNFKIPKVTCEIILYNDEFYVETENVILLSLYLSIIDNKLNSKMYYANLFQSGYSFGIASDHITLFLNGFNGNIENLVDLCIDALINSKITENEFNAVKYEMYLGIKNFFYESPFTVANDYFQEKLYTINHTKREIMNALSSITFQDINKAKQYFINKCKIKSFYYGNINKEIILKIEGKFKHLCKNKSDIKNHKKINLLEYGEQHTYIQKSINPEESNNLILVYFEVGTIIKNVSENWDINTLCVVLLEQFLHEKFFTQLRTKEQTGYVVRSFVNNYPNDKGYVTGISFMIQSHIYPNELRSRIKKFLKDKYEELQKLPDKEIELLKNSLEIKLKRKFESQGEEFSFMVEEIESGEYVFDHLELLSKKIKYINKKMLVDSYEKWILNKDTRKIRILEMYKHKEK